MAGKRLNMTKASNSEWRDLDLNTMQKKANLNEKIKQLEKPFSNKQLITTFEETWRTPKKATGQS